MIARYVLGSLLLLVWVLVSRLLLHRDWERSFEGPLLVVGVVLAGRLLYRIRRPKDRQEPPDAGR